MKDILGRPTRREEHGDTQRETVHAALLIDFDNVTMGIRSDLQNQLRKLLNSDIIKGKVSVQRAYADWRRYPQYIVPLSEASIDLIFAPAFGANKKNATDIRLAIDAMELVFARPEIGTFILLSGDSDFSALVLKLKEYGKYVIGVGIRESSSDLLIQNCDEYFSYSELTGLAREGEGDYVRQDPWELVVQATQRMIKGGDVMRSDRLKQVMQNIDPNFSEKDAGFNRFSKFVAEAGQRGLLSLKKMDNGQFSVELGSNANVLPEVEALVEGSKSEPNTKVAKTKRRRSPRKKEESSDLTLNESFDLLKQGLLALNAVGGDSATLVQVHEKMLALRGEKSDPMFENPRFQRFLRQAHDAGIIELIKSDAEDYLLKLSAVAAVEKDSRSEKGKASQAASTDEPTKRKAASRTAKGTKAVRKRRPPASRTKSSSTSKSPGDTKESSVQDSADVPAKAKSSGRRNPRFRRGVQGDHGENDATPEAKPKRAAPLAKSADSRKEAELGSQETLTRGSL